MKKIQLFVPTYHIDECLAEIRECFEVGWTGLGFKTVKFEDEWKIYTKLPNAHFVNSNTAGLQLVFKMLKQEFGWQDGDEVISTPFTFISTNHAIRYENLKPVFADIDETLCLDPESIKRKITARTKAVVYVGIGGNAGKLAQVKEICEANKLIFILDAAHMAGTYYQNKHVGSEADCAVFSFQAVKNLPTADGGMICFRDAELDKKARVWSWMGINKDTYARSNLVKGDYKWYYDVQCVGLNAHGNSVIASIGLVELKYLEQGNARRREICRQYLKYLSGQPEIGLIEFADDCLPSRHLFQIRVRPEWRDELMTYLNAKEIYPGVHYRVNTEYEMYRYALGSCPRAELAAKEVISLPLHLRLTDEEVAYVAQNVIEFLDSKK